MTLDKPCAVCGTSTPYTAYGLSEEPRCINHLPAAQRAGVLEGNLVLLIEALDRAGITKQVWHSQLHRQIEHARTLLNQIEAAR